MFVHNFIEFPSLKQINTVDGRRYVGPCGNRYPSITTLLSKLKLEQIEEWKKRIGEDTAKEITVKAAKKGTKIHKQIELFLSNEVVPRETIQFVSMKPILKRINNITCLETRMFSENLKVAGTVDCIGEYNGQLAVIDFKTSLKRKRKEWIDNYFMQACFYAIAYYEHTGVLPKLLVIIIANTDGETDVFTDPISNWIKPTAKTLDRLR